jgi:hypothetical protein
MAAVFNFSSPANARIFAISPEKVRVKKSVKYDIKPGINDNLTKTAVSLEPRFSK